MAEATAPKATKAAKKAAVYVVIGTDGSVIVEPSEIRALRTAVATGGKSKAVEFGQVVNPGTAAPAAPATPESY